MFDSHLKSTGRDYSLTIALLAGGCFFVPAVLVASRSFGAWPLAIAVFSSMLCFTLAWTTWRSHSKLTIPTLEDEPAVTK